MILRKNGICRSAAALLVIACAELCMRGDARAADPFMVTIPVRGEAAKIARESLTVYLVSSAEESFTLPGTPFQEIMKRENTGVRRSVLIRCGPARRINDVPSGAELSDTQFLNLENPEIRRIAKKLEGAKDPVDAVERFVNRYIVEKSYGIPLMSAVNILKARSGDCTEHTVLSVAILRAMGIHTRAVVGMVFAGEFEGRHDVFVFHMWAEAHREGGWRLVDSANPGGKIPNRYIAIAAHSLKTEAPLAYLKAIAAIRELRVERVGP